MAPQRERYNAAARRSTVGGRTHKGKRPHSETTLDPNAPLIDDEAAARQREEMAARRAALGAPAGMSAKKRKRLDAFIARGLQKERKGELLRKLESSSAEVGDRAALLSAATLGTGRALSGKQRLEGLERKADRKRRHRAASDDDEDADLDEQDGSVDRPEGEQLEDPARRARIQAVAARFAAPAGQASSSAAAPAAPAASGSAAPAAAVSAASVVAPALGSALAAPPPPMRKRARRRRKTPTPSESSFDSSESEAESVADDVLEAAMRARGVHWPGADGEAGDASDGTSEDEGSVAAGAGTAGSDAGSTDEDEDAVFREAMRRRGMWVPEMDAPEASGAAAESSSAESAESEGAASDEDAASADEEESRGSPAWLGFESEHEAGADDAGDASFSSASSSSGSSSGASSSGSARPLRPKAARKHNTARSSGFKDWARAEMGLAAAPADTPDGPYVGPTPVQGLVQRVGDLGPQDGVARGPLGGSIAPLSPFAARYFEESKQSGKAKAVSVTRDPAIQESRLQLPVMREEDLITRTILENPVTVLCGETGSGKTTQVPQFLYEAGFGSGTGENAGMIGVTQPRRVAALSMAARVGAELALPASRVSHQIRYDATVSASTSIKFMTDGVLLRELASDFLLSRYSAVLVDEAHERSTNTDVLIGVLSRVVKLRAQRWIDGQEGARPLRLVIMSATLRVSDFAENRTLFPEPPPIINVEARQHPVTVHFARRTKHDYVEEATKKAIKIHARLPAGGILIFLTGQQEIATVCKRLEARFGRRAIEERRRTRMPAQPADEREELIQLGARDGDVEAEEMDLGQDADTLALDVDGDGDDAPDDPDALESDEDEAAPAHDADLPDHLKDDSDVPLHILPLYSLLPSERQMRVFAAPPEGTRLCVVATNVAETSLTIPGITYVVDCGRSKERSFDAATGVQSFDVRWISKASASQRAGRAGRTGPGHCYRLYSSAVYEDTLPQFAVPEILRTPVEGLVLQMHAMHLDSVANFPFPTPPDRTALRRAERTLVRLGALEMADTARKTQAARATELGQAMSLFPLAPRFAKLLVQGQQHGCLPYVIALVSALSVGDPFVREQALASTAEDDDSLPAEAAGLRSEELRRQEANKERRRRFFAAMSAFSALGGGSSDTFRLLAAVGAYEYEHGGTSFCERNFLRPKAMQEIHKLRAQLGAIVRSRAAPGTDLRCLDDPQLPPPSETQLKVLRQLLASAYVDQVAVRADLVPEAAAALGALADESTEAGRQYSLQVRRGAKLASTRGVAYLVRSAPGQACFIHPSSALFHGPPPPWIIFDELYRGSSGAAADKVWLRTVTRINPAWLQSLARPLCSFAKPAEPAGGTAALVAAAAKGGQAQRDIVLVPSYGTGPAAEPEERNAGPGWELPPVKATQTLINGRWVTNLP